MVRTILLLWMFLYFTDSQGVVLSCYMYRGEGARSSADGRIVMQTHCRLIARLPCWLVILPVALDADAFEDT